MMLVYFRKLLYLTRGRHRSLLLMTLLFLFISLIEVFGTGIVGPFIAIATTPTLIKTNYWASLFYKTFNFNSEQDLLIFLGIFIVILFFVKSFLSFNAQKSVFKFGYTLRADLSYQLMKAYLGAPYEFHLHINSANLIQNIIATTDNVALGAVMPLLTAVSNCVIVFALLLLLIKTNAIAIILIGVLLPIVYVLLQTMKGRLARWSKDGWQASGEMIRVMNHSLGGLKETRVIGCEAYFEQQMEVQTTKYAKNLSLSQGFSNLPRYVIEAVMITFLISFTLIYLRFDRGDPQNLTGILGIFALASIRLLPAIGNLVSNVTTVRANTFAVDQLYFDLKNLEKEHLLPVSSPTGSHKEIQPYCNRESLSFFDKIELSDITFQYPNAARDALDEMSLTLKKGQSIGLIGRSGSGKTTLVDVILGLLVPQKGDITVDGISVYQSLRAWQNLLGYVPQSIFLIDDTLERNIAFGVPDAQIDQHALKEAVKLAQLEEVVQQLPGGLGTVVGERGILLSGGQRQRVGIARVLYHQREILVFDEATAALDNETEHLVTEATKALSGSKTIIIIAHRLSTIEHCDYIYQVENGRIVKSGSYAEVVLGQH